MTADAARQPGLSRRRIPWSSTRTLTPIIPVAFTAAATTTTTTTTTTIVNAGASYLVINNNNNTGNL